MSLQSHLKSQALRIDARLQDLLPASETEPTVLHEAMRYSCLAPGKRIRPILCLEACRSVEGDDAHALDAACAIEMIHTFSLIHDDLPAIDNDDVRRGRPTCHVKFGEAIAIMAGDSLFAFAFDVVSHSAQHAAAVVRALQILTRASGSLGLAGGETVDILSEGKEVDADTLDYIHRNKTGALIRAACEVGGALGGGGDNELASLRAYGEHVGLAFQIADDILNVTGSAEKLGKAIGSDHERKKATYPALHGLEASQKRARDEVAQAIEAVADLPADKSTLIEIAQFAITRLH